MSQLDSCVDSIEPIRYETDHHVTIEAGSRGNHLTFISVPSWLDSV